MSFRPATLEDADQLFFWRLRDLAGLGFQGKMPSLEAHHHWLTDRIRNPLVRLLIWEDDDVPSGAVRVDSNGEFAFHGDDPDMLQAATWLAALYGGRLKATLDAHDPKQALLEQAGFTGYPASALIYRTV